MSVTPELLDPTPLAAPFGQPIYYGDVGPWEHGSDLYFLVDGYNVTQHIAVYKLTGGALPATIFTTGFSDTNQNGNVSTCYRGGNIIYVAWQGREVSAGRGHIHATSFDMSTDSFGADNDSGVTITDSGGIFIKRLSNGNLVVVYDNNFGVTGRQVQFIVYNGATWSAPALISAGTGVNFVDFVVQDNSDNVAVFWDNGVKFFYTTITAGVASAAVIALDPIPANFQTTAPFTGGFDPISNSIFWTTANKSGSDRVIQTLVASPPLSPSFSLNTLATDVTNVFGWLQPLHCTDGAGNFSLFVWGNGAGAQAGLVQEWTATSLLGTYTGPTVYYDQIAQPPTPPPDGVEAYPIYGRYLSDSQAHVTIGMFYKVVSTDFCGVPVYLVPSGATTQTLELTKVIAGGPASPSDFTVSATGGSPEVDISGDGHVGPVEVSPGTYELAEVAFPSITWGNDPSPWGPDTWGGNYSQGNWDCGPAFMPTPTSVVVAAGSGGSPFIAATQVPSDTTYRALLSGGKYEFHIGSYVYQVLFNSAGKLGVFRRAAASSGSAWTLMDSVHAPGSLSGNGEVTQSGTTIAIAYLETGNVNMRIVEFETVTDTWGTPTIAKAMISSLATFAFVRRSDNTYVIVAGRPNTIYLVTNTGGLWSGFTILATLGSGATVLSGVIDSSDRIWPLINTASTTVGVYSISSIYVLSSVIASVSLLFPGLPYPYIYYPQITLWGTDAVAVAWNTALTIGGAGNISVKTITPLAAPVVTTSVAYTFGAGTERAFLFQPVDDGSGNLNLFLVDTNTGVNKILKTLFDGVSTWGATSTFYDAVADPPPTPASPSNISALQALKLTAGWTAGLTMQTTGPVDTAEFVEVVSPTNSVACQIVNTFIPTPPPPPPPGGAGENAVGCFELLRVDVTLTPSKRLPVRGSTK